VRIRLRGTEDDDISPGFVLTNVNKPVHAVRQFEAQLAILDHKNINCAGYSAVMQLHTLAEEVTLCTALFRQDDGLQVAEATPVFQELPEDCRADRRVR